MKRRVKKKTSKASRSSAAPASCSPRSSRRSACRASRSTSPTSSSAGRRAIAIPSPDEVATCEPFLFRQIDAIQPKVIVPLGKFAAQCLLKTMDPITRLRGRQFDYRGAVLIPTFHPGLFVAQSVGEARSVGRHEEGSRYPAIRGVRQSAIRNSEIRDRLVLSRCRCPRSASSPIACLATECPRAGARVSGAGRSAYADRRRARRGRGRRYRLHDQADQAGARRARIRAARRREADRNGFRSTTSPVPARRSPPRCRRMASPRASIDSRRSGSSR